MKVIFRAETPLVKDPRNEIADSRVQAARVGQEDTAVGGEGRAVVAEYVFERGYFGAGWMHAFLRLFQLCWITDENQTSRCPRDGQSVGQRHLASFVDDQNIDGPRESVV